MRNEDSDASILAGCNHFQDILQQNAQNTSSWSLINIGEKPETFLIATNTLSTMFKIVLIALFSL